MSGRAEKAYGGTLTRAERDVVYVRPGTIVVRDRLASSAPRTWEWNIHAVNRMTKVSERRIALRDGPAQMCVEMAAGPDVAFTQTDRFTAPPSGSREPSEWHGTFATTARSPQAEFLTVMRVGSDCGAGAAEAARAGDGWRVSVDGRIVELSADRIGVK